MLLQQIVIDSAASKRINEYLSEGFWERWDFWIFVVIGIAGTIYAFLAYREAGEAFDEAEIAAGEAGKAFTEARDAKDAATAAKMAAQEAAKTVHKQDIIIILTEILNECQLRGDVKYSEASIKHKLIHQKIKYIRGLYSKYLNEEQIKFLESIEGSLAVIRSSLDLFNTAISGEVSSNAAPDLLSLTLDGAMTTLAGNIELLKGALTASLV